MDKGISIIICSYNGSLRIPQTIAHVAAQEIPKEIPWEVIFVDNASRDNTSETAMNEWHKHVVEEVNFKLIKENKPGKIYALHHAVWEAAFEYFIICDDDNWLDRKYTATMYNVLESDDGIGAVGGQSTGVTSGIPFPGWFAGVAPHYAVGQQGGTSGDITKRGYLWGAGLGSRTALYKKMYENFPSLLTGRNGNLLTAGEDSEYCQRLVLSGYKLYYDAGLLFQHFIPDNRLSDDYKDALLKGLEASDVILDKYRVAIQLQQKYRSKPLKKITAIITSAVKNIFQSSPGKKIRNRRRLQYLLPFDTKYDPVISAIKIFYELHH
jgi:glycosyltransferase involved in cell wall biosynthesis